MECGTMAAAKKRAWCVQKGKSTSCRTGTSSSSASTFKQVFKTTTAPPHFCGGLFPFFKPSRIPSELQFNRKQRLRTAERNGPAISSAHSR